ncbi:putative Proteasome subunit alpha type-1 [Paratrimastix pyriformis]|uniref:Proteasome subunit alpha type n=1 Tax=Paratrimastix pyriformis TaxID=342808 RepID=A0ABQ8UI99_9EUKA|nr:putative Proteasome subunit alpha type-1 [Paratrimastix pyriformis]
MYRTAYDSDVTIFSPQGRLYQIEYAMEAVKQGAATAGLKSNTHVVLVAIKRNESQQKVLALDQQIGASTAGLTADARKLLDFMKSEIMNFRWAHESQIPVNWLAVEVSDKSQKRTQHAGSRPFGVGMLIAGVDSQGTHLYQTCPSGNYFDYYSCAIGARSQPVKTYLEKHYKEFPTCSREELIKHALQAIKASQPDEELDTTNCSVGVVGVDEQFTVFEGERLLPFDEATMNLERHQ